jgi:hypothetical protein
MYGMLPNRAAVLVLLQSGAIVITHWGLILIPDPDDLEVKAFYGGKFIAKFVLSSHGLQAVEQHPDIEALWNEVHYDGEVVDAVGAIVRKLTGGDES